MTQYLENKKEKHSILLVDDRDDNLLALEEILNELGQDVVRARSGPEALKLVFDRDFAVILLDVRMPGMDGFEAAELIRKRKRSRHTPIIFITAADATPEQIARGYSVGAVDYIFKPYMPEVLKAKVRIFLELFKKREELRESEARLRTLVKNVPGAMYRREATTPWEMIYVSDPIEKLCGYPATDFVDRGRAYANIVHSEDVRAYSDALEEAARNQAPYNLEYRIIGRDDRICWVLDRGQWVPNGTPGVQYLDGVLLDITDRRVAEEGLSELLGRFIQTQDEERRRLALELHDSTSPLLTGLIGKLYSLRHRTPAYDPATTRTLEESLKLSEDTSKVIRNVSNFLHPQLLDDNGLLASLRWYVSGFAERTGIPVEMKFPAELRRLPRETETALFRIVQESLANVLRHSGSSMVSVRISVEGHDLLVEIGDQGHGIPQMILSRFKEGAVVLGTGLASMRKRMWQLGGQLEISSTRSGTIITAMLPLDPLKA